MKDFIDKYFDTPEKKEKLYLLIIIAQIWAIIAMVLGIVLFLYFLLSNMGLF